MLTGSRDAAFSVVKQLKCLAFSVFSRCRKSLQLNINAKSLTGFGPAARHEALLRQREVSTVCTCMQIFDMLTYFPLITPKVLNLVGNHKDGYFWKQDCKQSNS